MKKRFRISIVIMMAMLLGISVLVPVANAEGTATGSLNPSTTSVEVGETFTVTLWIDTGADITKGFTIRRLVFDINLIQLTNISFGSFYQAVCDNEENRTRIINTLNINGTGFAYINGGDIFGSGFTGNNIAVIFKFVTIQKGETDIEIPLTFWNGAKWAPGLEVVYMDSTIWTNTDIEIIDSTPPEDPPNGGGGGGGTGGGGGSGGGGGTGGGGGGIPPVPNIPPVADGRGPFVALVNESITFDGSGSYDSDGEIVSYLWVFSDGLEAIDMISNHTYTQVDNYTVKLTVTDNDGNFSNYFTYAFITEPIPDEPDEPDEPDIPDDNDTTPVTPTEDFPLPIFIGVILVVILIILIIVSLLRRRKNE